MEMERVMPLRWFGTGPNSLAVAVEAAVVEEAPVEAIPAEVTAHRAAVPVPVLVLAFRVSVEEPEVPTVMALAMKRVTAMETAKATLRMRMESEQYYPYPRLTRFRGRMNSPMMIFPKRMVMALPMFRNAIARRCLPRRGTTP